MEVQYILNNIMERLRCGESVPVKEEYAQVVAAAAEKAGIPTTSAPEKPRRKKQTGGKSRRLIFQRKVT